jgi:hypothetical protein
MSLLPHQLPVPNNSPLHSILLSFGKGLLKRSAPPVTLPLQLESITTSELLSYTDVGLLEKRARELTVKQLATLLRMSAEESDDISMLNSLESLVLAGEISPSDFIGRMQNLFPRAMGSLDISMQMKVAALLL